MRALILRATLGFVGQMPFQVRLNQGNIKDMPEMLEETEGQRAPAAAWFEPEEDESAEITVRDYDITASPNDFNMLTLFNFIGQRAIKIPGFQRNYVWDIKRASKLIESLIKGLPVPQIFLYDEGKNSLLVIDGQQRLMSIFYFMKGRFPRKDKRVELRRIFEDEGVIPDAVLNNDEFFDDFELNLPGSTPGQPNRLHKQNYESLGNDRMAFDLRAIRSTIIKQNLPDNDDSSMYEIFNRLNSGGVMLTPQEIRTSLYHSKFYELLYRLNALPQWQKLLGVTESDLHMKDVEVLLRGFAMLMDGNHYAPSMVKFLNSFSNKAKKLQQDDLSYLERLFGEFLKACDGLPDRPFHGKQNRFVILTFEAVFAVTLGNAFERRSLDVPRIDPKGLSSFKADPTFGELTKSKTTSTANVEKRIELAKQYLDGAV